MPAVHFRVRWPDGSVETCYSPSTIIKDYFEPGQSYALPDFVGLCRQGLHAASDRVRVRYGSGCSQAMAQLAAIEAKALRQPNDAPPVRVEGFDL
jgi:uncharacterized repeat protein (TIGR04042 family)